MIRRAFWLAAGVTIGVVAVRKMSQARSTLGPEGLNRAVGQIGDSIADFADAFRTSMNEREDDLRVALGVQEPAVVSEVVPETPALRARRARR